MSKSTVKSFVLSIVLVLCSGCSQSDVVAPFSYALVCGEKTCSSDAQKEILNAWLADGALHRPGSSFAVWRVPQDGQLKRLFGTCIPLGWGSNAMQRRNAFVEEIRSGILHGGNYLSDNCHPISEDIPPRWKIHISGNLMPGENEVFIKDSVPPAAPRNVTVVCDRSNSGEGFSCTSASLRKAYQRFIKESNLEPGSSFSVFLVGDRREHTRKLAAYSVTDDANVGRRLARALTAMPNVVHMPNNGKPYVNASAVIETINIAVEETKGISGQQQLEIHSDLRQVTKGKWNFERSIPAADRFIHWIRSENLLVNLKDFNVAVCGLHHRSGPDASKYSARQAVNLKSVWDAVFTSMGAQNVCYSNHCF